MVRFMSYVVALVAMVVGGRALVAADGHAGHAHGMGGGQSSAAAVAGDPYLLPNDPVTGEKLGTNAVVVNYEGRELRFASKQNAERFQADPKAYLGKVDEQMIEQQKPFYALATCPVTGEKLDSMGGGKDIIYKNRLVRFCCGGCQKDFEKDPATYLKKLDEAAIKAQKPNYALKECVVSGESLGSMGDGVDYVAGNRLVRFCCGGCIDKFKQNPTAYLEKLSAGSGAPAQGHGAHAGH